MLKVDRMDDVVRVKVQVKRLDTEVAPEIGRQFVALAESGDKHFLLDLSDVEFIDSEGLDIVLCLQRRVGRGGLVELTGVTGNVMKVFKLTRLSRSMTINQAA